MMTNIMIRMFRSTCMNATETTANEIMVEVG